MVYAEYVLQLPRQAKCSITPLNGLNGYIVDAWQVPYLALSNIISSDILYPAVHPFVQVSAPSTRQIQQPISI